MAIYRGDGGAGDATNNITINQITELSSDAQAAAVAAASSATSASSSASAASTSATNAASSATSAGTSATNAASSASSASTSASNASTSETNAAASETAAAASEAAAALSETAAAASETNAASSASSASTSASTATTQATNAATSATNAATSASAASTSETNAATSETNAATSETNAAASATSASNDAATATTKASEASTSASNAATSETNAAASESAAATSATNASTSETNAAASETAAASSASAAATSATNAATSASSASTSASNAATSASNAATSETNAATSETNAAASATAAAASAATVPVYDSTTGEGLNFVRLNVGETSMEFRTPAEVRSDIGAEPADATILKDADIGSTVQAYDADIPTVAASQIEMETGTETALRSMSPLRVSQAIAALASAGSGDLLASNNLSDLDSASTALTNLGISNHDNITVDGSNNLKFDSGYGSSATAYGVRAWVNFNGATVAIREDGNVSSITDNGTGRYQINFSTALADTKYAVCGLAGRSTSSNNVLGLGGSPQNVSMLTTSCRIITTNIGGSSADMTYITVAIIR